MHDSSDTEILNTGSNKKNVSNTLCLCLEDISRYWPKVKPYLRMLQTTLSTLSNITACCDVI